MKHLYWQPYCEQYEADIFAKSDYIFIVPQTDNNETPAILIPCFARSLNIFNRRRQKKMITQHVFCITEKWFYNLSMVYTRTDSILKKIGLMDADDEDVIHEN